jgi:hypothetical protein
MSEPRKPKNEDYLRKRTREFIEKNADLVKEGREIQREKKALKKKLRRLEEIAHEIKKGVALRTTVLKGDEIVQVIDRHINPLEREKMFTDTSDLVSIEQTFFGVTLTFFDVPQNGGFKVEFTKSSSETVHMNVFKPKKGSPLPTYTEYEVSKKGQLLSDKKLEKVNKILRSLWERAESLFVEYPVPFSVELPSKVWVKKVLNDSLDDSLDNGAVDEVIVAK